MTLNLFYAFLAGFSEFFGLLPSHVWKVLDNASELNSPIFSLAVCAGSLNGIVLFLIKQKFSFKKYLPYIGYGFVGATLNFVLESMNVHFGLRSVAFILLIFSACLYLQNFSFQESLDKKSTWLVSSVLLALPFMPIGLFLLSAVKFQYKESLKVLRNLAALTIPCMLVVTIKYGTQVDSAGKLSGVEISLAYILSCFGSFLAFYLILKVCLIKKQDWLRHAFTALACLLLYFTSRYGDVSLREQMYSIQFQSMGTACEVTVWHSSKSNAETSLQDAKNLFDKIENTLSTYKPESEITKLNKDAHKEAHKCSQILWQNLILAEAGWKASNGAFDVTIGPLVKLWGIKNKRKELPSSEEISLAKSLVGFGQLIIDHEKQTVKFPKEGFRIDFGGLTKGWAVDQARDLLYSRGITKGIINLGGNIYCFKEPSPKKDIYHVGIKDPFKPTELAMTLPLLGQGVATSGNYEQFIIIDGKRYTHIIDPRTGMPVDSADGVTVISNSATWCDILSTAFFIEGQPLIEKVVSENSQVNVWFVKKDQTSGEVLSQKTGMVWDKK